MDERARHDIVAGRGGPRVAAPLARARWVAEQPAHPLVDDQPVDGVGGAFDRHTRAGCRSHIGRVRRRRWDGRQRTSGGLWRLCRLAAVDIEASFDVVLDVVAAEAALRVGFVEKPAQAGVHHELIRVHLRRADADDIRDEVNVAASRRVVGFGVVACGGEAERVFLKIALRRVFEDRACGVRAAVDAEDARLAMRKAAAEGVVFGVRVDTPTAPRVGARGEPKHHLVVH
mmetsp:Transcript_24442/g.75695  ORF Transcript_24442/g.75695 Transcript_24442/m.75695 type:complete len:230 (+) Transcript_24442:510-1199(+)